MDDRYSHSRAKFMRATFERVAGSEAQKKEFMQCLDEALAAAELRGISHHGLPQFVCDRMLHVFLERRYRNQAAIVPSVEDRVRFGVEGIRIAFRLPGAKTTYKDMQRAKDRQRQKETPLMHDDIRGGKKE